MSSYRFFELRLPDPPPDPPPGKPPGGGEAAPTTEPSEDDQGENE